MPTTVESFPLNAYLDWSQSKCQMVCGFLSIMRKYYLTPSFASNVGSLRDFFSNESAQDETIDMHPLIIDIANGLEYLHSKYLHTHLSMPHSNGMFAARTPPVAHGDLKAVSRLIGRFVHI
jgi:hypothetical protein